jgi:hypothetical protein
LWAFLQTLVTHALDATARVDDSPEAFCMEDPLTLTNGDLVGPAEIHQAAGMLTVQLGTPIAEAFIRLRAYAVAAHRPVLDVSRDIIGRRVTLPESDDPE